MINGKVQPDLSAVLNDVQNRLCFMERENITIHTRSFLGDTPLHLMATEGKLNAVELLLEAGADPDARGDLDFTPLHCAAISGHTHVVAALLAAGASPHSTDISGRRPADLATSDEIVSLLATQSA